MSDSEDRMLPFQFDLKSSSLVLVSSSESLPSLQRALQTSSLVGMDTETQPSFKKRKHTHFLTHPTAILQLATRITTSCSSSSSSNNNNNNRQEEVVFIIDLLICLVDHDFQKKLDEILLEFVLDKNILKIGQGLENDFDELHMSYPSMKSFQRVEGIVETHALVKQLQPDLINMISLKALVKTYLHHELIKTQQCSNWGVRPLSASQIQYAACDALVLLRLYDAMLCEIEEIYEEKEEEFVIESIVKAVNLTLPRPLTVSAIKRKSSFFQTRELLRSKTKTGLEVCDVATIDSVSEEETVLQQTIMTKQRTHTRFDA